MRFSPFIKITIQFNHSAFSNPNHALTTQLMTIKVYTPIAKTIRNCGRAIHQHKWTGPTRDTMALPKIGVQQSFFNCFPLSE